jgi:CRP-like cAMP-binding protein/Tfp pilus assembly protein PilZ
MKRKKERRRHLRELLPTPELCIVYPRYDKVGKDTDHEDECDTLLVYILNMSKGGILLESSKKFKTGSLLDMRLQLAHEKAWMAYTGEVVWGDNSPIKSGHHLLGIKFKESTLPEELPTSREPAVKKRMYPSDLEFLMETTLFDAISEEAKCPLLNVMTPRHVKAGQRIISQGDKGDSFYVIQKGSCLVNLEKEGTHHPIARLRVGDIVGEMAILTGECRVANVDTEKNMTLWSVSRTDFDMLCEEYPDLRNFLSELVTYRFSTERMTADRIVGKYLINEIMDRGGWSIVYRGNHTRLNMPVAIKMLKHDMAMDPIFSEKFRKEAKTIAQLNHQNIVRVYDIEELYRTIFIIMEYLDGVPLDHILERIQRLPLSRALDILMQTCAGLAYAHEHGIVHQDIKPANIFVQPDDQVKIVDFGLACSPGDIDCSLRGTIFYASPEAIDGEPVDERADIYALGITAFEMITGHRPFPEDNITKMINSRLNDDIPDPRTFIPDLPDELYKFIIRATQRNPADRYKNISQPLLDLEPLAGKLDIKRQPPLREHRNVMSLFLFYQDQHELVLKHLVEKFSLELKEIGAELRAAKFKDL